MPNGTSCDDADPTTCTDVCTTGSCAGTPVAEPLEIDPSLTIGKGAGGIANISWTDAPGPYNVYRGSNRGGAPWLYNQTCFVHETTSPTVDDPMSPPVNTVFYYLVSRVNACRESIIGRNGAGAPIDNNNPCGSPPQDVDQDQDGITDFFDNCPLEANAGQLDADGDGHGDVCDNCAEEANSDQSDGDEDAIGDVCDPIQGLTAFASRMQLGAEQVTP